MRSITQYLRPVVAVALTCTLFTAGLTAQSTPQPSVKILLPERTRLLDGQLVDLVLEVRNTTSVSGLSVTAGANDITSKFTAKSAQLDCNSTPDWVIRADLQSFAAGSVKLQVNLLADGKAVSDSRTIDVRPFSLSAGRRNVILFIGDAMGTAYRDAARLVSRSILDDKGNSSFREGFFDNLLEMDKMPISGNVMTYGSDSVVPDSANTGTNWATGNKSYLNAVNSLADGTDCQWRFNGATNASNLGFILDNPRVENLWQYLKRRFKYRTGVVTTADVTDATPAVEGAYSGYRQTRFEIARQYRENPMLGGRPALDVIFGGGKDQFTASARTDKRDLIGEFQSIGYRYVQTATELKALRYGQPTLGLFRGNLTPASNSVGLAASDSNMDVAYDKLGLTRPASEPVANLQGYTDQPMLDLMTQKAIEILSQGASPLEALSGTFGTPPFILMVEGASIDKQSHPNNSAGTIWDTIELDKAVGAARAWAANRNDTLILVTADHDQSMSIIGVSNSADSDYFDRTKSVDIAWKSGRGDQSATVWGDSFSNTRAGLPFTNSSDVATNNKGAGGMPSTIPPTATAANPYGDTYSTYYGFPAYNLDPKTGYPTNVAAPGSVLRRLAVGYRTGDHTGSTVPVTAEGPGAYLFTGYQDQTDLFFKMALSITGDTADGDKIVDQIRNSSNYPKTFGK